MMRNVMALFIGIANYAEPFGERTDHMMRRYSLLACVVTAMVT